MKIPTPNARPSLLLCACSALGLFAGCSSTDSHLVSAPPPPTPVLTTTVATPIIVTTPEALTPTGTYTAVVVTQVPPTAIVEARVAQPSSRHAWVPGYWTWRDSQYQWMGGHWEIPPFANAAWNAPTWAKEGSSYRFYEGSWK